MKNAKVLLATVLLLGNIAVTGSAMAANGVIEKEEVFPDGSYCHTQFRAMDPYTLGSEQPSLKSSDSTDIVDFYGACDESPTGQDQVWDQKWQHFFRQTYP
jgi:hypothetical protein